MSHALANVAAYRSDDAARIVVAVTLDVDRVDLAHEVVCRFAPTGAERKFSFAGLSGRAEFPHPEATTVTVDIDKHTPVDVPVPDEFGEDNAVTVHDAVRIEIPDAEPPEEDAAEGDTEADTSEAETDETAGEDGSEQGRVEDDARTESDEDEDADEGDGGDEEE